MSKIMGAGDRDELITFEKQTRVDDGKGGASEPWTVFAADVWAAVKPVQATEAERQGAVRNPQIYLFTIERQDDLNETMRIKWDGKTFNIREIRKPGNRKLVMEIKAESGVTQ